MSCDIPVTKPGISLYEQLTGYYLDGQVVRKRADGEQPSPVLGVPDLEGVNPAHPPERKYPFPTLEVGESAFVEARQATAQASAYAYTRRHGKGFRVVATTLNGKTGVTIKRVK